MKKNFLKLTLILLMTILVLSLVACDPATPTPDDDSDVTPVDPDPITFTVTFDSKGGTQIEGYTGVEFGQTVPAPAYNPTKTGYIFDGWALTNGDPVDFDTYTVHSNVTFFATWKAKTYNITAYMTDEGRKDQILDLNTNTVSEYYGDIFAVDNSTLEQVDLDGVSVWRANFTLSYESTISSTQSLPVPKTTKANDRFMYWYYYDGDTIVPLTETLAQGSQKTTIALKDGYNYDGSRTIYPMWYSALDNITVTFNSGRDDIAISIADITLKDGDHIAKPTSPEAVGYDFNKWTYILKDKDNNDVVCDMSFYLDPSQHGTHITMDMTTDGVFTLYGNWTKHIEINSASDWTSLDITNEEVQSANIYLMNDIELNDYTTIFNTSNPFSGVFDGNEHTITINITGGSEGCFALIGVNEGVVKRLTLTGSQITASPEENDIVYAGLVAGISRGTITGVSVSLSSLVISAPTNTCYVGGVVGANYGEISNVQTLSNAGITLTANKGYVGGVVGLNASGFVIGANITDLDIVGSATTDLCAGFVAGKINYGDTEEIVIANSELNISASQSAYAGGIAGSIANNTASNCSLSNCNIIIGEETVGDNAYAGGVVGEGGSAIRNVSLDAVNVTITSNNITVAGGVVGINFCEGGNRGQIQFVVAKGSVSATSGKKVYVGGISGQQNAGASSSNGAVAYVYSEFNVSASTLEGATLITVKIGKAFGSLDKSTTCQNVFVTDNTTLAFDDVVYNADDKQFDVTIHTAIQQITPSYETIQNATWVSKQLKLDSNIWVVADGTYPTLKIAG